MNQRLQPIPTEELEESISKLERIFPVERDLPCRVSADLRIKDQQETAYDAPEFTYMESDFRQILPKELAMPLELLFSTVSQIEAINGSFGSDAVAAEKALKWLMHDIRRFEEQILVLWENA